MPPSAEEYTWVKPLTLTINNTFNIFYLNGTHPQPNYETTWSNCCYLINSCNIASSLLLNPPGPYKQRKDEKWSSVEALASAPQIDSAGIRKGQYSAQLFWRDVQWSGILCQCEGNISALLTHGYIPGDVRGDLLSWRRVRERGLMWK